MAEVSFNQFTQQIKNAASAVQKQIPLNPEQAKTDKSEWLYRQLEEQIKRFQNKLSADQEVGVMLAGFGQPVVMSLERVGFQYPDVISFWGSVNRSAAQLIQQIGQLSYMLIALNAPDHSPARRIAFGMGEG